MLRRYMVLFPKKHSIREEADQAIRQNRRAVIEGGRALCYDPL